MLKGYTPGLQRALAGASRATTTQAHQTILAAAESCMYIFIGQALTAAVCTCLFSPLACTLGADILVGIFHDHDRAANPHPPVPIPVGCFPAVPNHQCPIPGTCAQTDTSAGHQDSPTGIVPSADSPTEPITQTDPAADIRKASRTETLAQRPATAVHS